MPDADYKRTIRERFSRLKPFLNEQLLRLYAAAESLAIGYGGSSVVSRETGVSRRAILVGVREIKHPEHRINKGVRIAGAGRKKTSQKDPSLKADLEKLIEPTTRGDPESSLRWTCKSVRKLAEELKRQGHKTSHRMVAELLHEMEYSLQANEKTKEGGKHPDRNAQFEYIAQKVQEYQEEGQPVISVDTKKKELVGDFKNPGKELRPKGSPEKVRVHDFEIPGFGKVAPYGVYDVAKNLGWVNLGTDNDTSAFAVESIRQWWLSMGSKMYPEAKKLLITADGGGSNGSKVKLWKLELQKLANELRIEIAVCHFPPGTSKWNKIEHKLFSFISQNWRGKPLLSHEVIVRLIAATTTKTGLRVTRSLDKKKYPKGIKVSKQEFGDISIQRNEFHGEWNYLDFGHLAVRPHQQV